MVKWGVAAVAGFVSLSLVVASLLLSTNGGSRWLAEKLASRVNQAKGTTLVIGDLQGSLVRGLRDRAR